MRKSRKLKKYATYHVMSRANRKEMIFNNPGIKEMFLDIVRRAQKKYCFTIKNFCIMGNHFHLIIRPQKNENLSRIMQWILSVFALKFNRLFNYSGHVWYDRFTSKIINSFMQYLTTFIYIAMNPVTARIAETTTEYEYNGISFLQKGVLDILERPPNRFLRQVWTKIHQYE